MAISERCIGGPPTCCQPAALTPEQVAQVEYRLVRIGETLRAEIPRRCGWCGCPSVVPVFATNRRAWECTDCRKEFTTGVVG